MLNKLLSAKVLFFLIVVGTTVVTAVYNFFIATPVYVTTAQIIVKNLNSGGGLEGFGTLLSSIGVLQPSTTGAYIVRDYMLSKDAMFKLDKLLNLKQYYSSQKWDILQRFDPFGLDPSYENFYKYYRDKVVEAYVDSKTSVISLKTRAADADYSYQISKHLIELSEKFVNQLNKRSSLVALSYYKEQLEKARQKLQNFAKQIEEFLKKEKLISPEQQAATLLQLISQLQSQLISVELELATLRAAAPNNPKIKFLQEQARLIRQKIDELMRQLFDSKNSLAGGSVKLELLKSQFLLLQKEVEMNLMAFLQAQNQAYLQHLFIETLDKPRIPDAPTEPEKFKNVFVAFTLSFAVWGILVLFIAGIREHVNA